MAKDWHGLHILAVHAHPDDESITTGGLLAEAASRGATVTVVTCTLGEEGEVIGQPLQHMVVNEADQLGGYRYLELAQALAELGVNGPDHEPVLLGGAGRFRDSGMAGSPARDRPRAFVNGHDAAVAELVQVLRKYQPQIVVTYAPDGGYGHPDHIAAHKVTHAAVARLRAEAEAAKQGKPGQGMPGYAYAPQRIYWTITSQQRQDAALADLTEIPQAWQRADGQLAALPETADDVVFSLNDEAVAAKVAAMRAHATQIWIADGLPTRSNPEVAVGRIRQGGEALGMWALSNLLAQPVMREELYRIGFDAAGATAAKDIAEGIVRG